MLKCDYNLSIISAKICKVQKKKKMNKESFEERKEEKNCKLFAKTKKVCQ